MTGLNLNNAEFIKSAADPSGFLRAELPCIVFAGKSNVGKSSVINRVLNRRNFARGAHTLSICRVMAMRAFPGRSASAGAG